MVYNDVDQKNRKVIMMFNFLLNENLMSGIFGVLSIVLLVVFFYFFMLRPQKKQEKKDAEMRNSLAVGDEVTTIGGIIGKVVSIKEETFVLETTKDRTKIRFLKGAIRSVDVRIADVVAAEKADKEATEATEEENK
jgi:preprotein translocase subunit YajC